MAIDYDPITADIASLATTVRAVSLAFNNLVSELNSHQSAIVAKTEEIVNATSQISDYATEAAAAAAEKNSLINHVLAIQEEVGFSGPAETRESLEKYYE